MRGGCAFIEPIQIDVIEEQPATVRIDQSERRTGYLFFINAERMGNAFTSIVYPRRDAGSKE